MNKDVIYIDLEDDITAIISKVKAADSKIVALVPPKRAGVLQSAVNLKLLQKAAHQADKRIVLITNDHSLTALAAGLKMPVAKNLQSRPEVPEVAEAAADEEEVINGAELPVGDVAAAMGTVAAATTASADAEATDQEIADELGKHVDLSDAPKATDLKKQEAVKEQKSSAMKKLSGNFKIPDFTTFRNKLFLFGGGALVVVGLLIWALVFAPHVGIVISAQTTGVNVDRTLTLDPKSTASDTPKLALKPNVQQLKKSVVTTFTATGSKDIGGKATGNITVYNCDSGSSFTIAAGTTFTSDEGRTFTSNAAVTVSGLTGLASLCRNSGSHPGAGTGTVAVTATAQGDEYNIEASFFDISGIDGDIFAHSNAAMTGGSHQQATVVSQADIDKAKQSLEQPNDTASKNDLKKQFVGDFIIIDESFVADQGQPVVEPALDQPAQQAKITIETTYTLVGIARDDVKKVLTDVANDALKGQTNQQMYSLGDKSLMFQTFQKAESGVYTTRITTSASIGPKIDTKALAKDIVGKRFGEIQALVNAIPGVSKVDVDMSPFWVTTAPGVDKIDISFSVANDK